MAERAFTALASLIFDWFSGDPPWLWKWLPHPIVLFGKAVAILDRRLNHCDALPSELEKRGLAAICLLTAMAFLSGFILEWLTMSAGSIGWLVEAAIMSVFLAQKSLIAHVMAVAEALRQKGVEQAREKVALIVGRDTQSLDVANVARAAIESLAENFCDGVVAPVFWYLVFGLPGLLAYKMINTADSMIAYRKKRYLHFGRATAKIDDWANWVPARLSALLIVLGARIRFGKKRALDAFRASLRDAGLHRSPNAGWPEAAMAGACNVTLGGPNIYGGRKTSQAVINATGKRDLKAEDILQAVGLFSFACYVFWAIMLVGSIL